MTPLRFAYFALAAALCLGGASARAAAPDLSGQWELRYDSRSVPDAALTAAARQATRTHQYQDVEALRWCRQAGMPALMDSPLDIRQGRIEIAIISPMTTIARHLYIDGRKQVDLNDFETTAVGNSVAHWDNDALVVHTIGFSDRGIVSIPGGGFRTAKSELDERYRLSADGKRLIVSYTWNDRSVFAAPHTYTFMYYRRPANTNQIEWPCEPNDEERAKFFEPALKPLKK